MEPPTVDDKDRERVTRLVIAGAIALVVILFALFNRDRVSVNWILFERESRLIYVIIGSALLETILYYYYEGKLYGVAFHTNDGQDTLNLKSIFAFAFGDGQDSDDSGPSTIWIGKKNGALFDVNTSTGDGSGFIFDHKLHDAYLKYETEAAQKAAGQLIKGE